MSQKIELRNLHLKLGGNQILNDVSLEVEAGSFVTLLGPSGSGKTTTLSTIAGFLKPQQGEVLFGGRDVSALPPGARNLGIVFQDYAIFPHMTIGENVAFPLKARKWKGDVNNRVADVLELVQLNGFQKRRASTLSGGQKQRIALARALVSDPAVLLLDEPLSALDKQLREAMQIELKEIQRSVGVTTISVTHDQAEALSMSDQVVVMNNGRVEQAGTAEEIYDRPRTEFLARFLGEVNLLPVDSAGMLVPFGLRTHGNAQHVAAIRPESVSYRYAEREIARQGEVEGVIETVQFHGSNSRLKVRIPAHPDPLIVQTKSTGIGSTPRPGSSVLLSVEGSIHLISRTERMNEPEHASSSKMSRMNVEPAPIAGV